ncbi:MAG: RNase adapter RapZ [Nitrospirae bacterium]|nr:RNase adapter RapZ [Nitrospirota bacterium]
MGQPPLTAAEKRRLTPGPSRRSRILIVSGLSGAGKTVALRAVEDSGFYCVDNIPVSLIASLIEKISHQHHAAHIAIGIDIREKEFLGDFRHSIAELRKVFPVDVLFLEAEPSVLIRRFKETRRPHPLGGTIDHALQNEKRMLSVLKNSADRVIDTSALSPHDLRKLVVSFYAPRSVHKDLAVSLISFGFKYGIPQNIDLLFDVRFLPNPYFIPSLKNLDGTDTEVSQFVFSHAVTRQFVKKIRDLLAFLIPQYIQEGKTYISIAFGCTGGKHRSPAIVEKIAKSLPGDTIERHIIHRDLP